MWIKYNPNPKAIRVGDCAVRAVAKANELSWEKAYLELCLQGYMMSDMPSSNAVWGMFLKRNGFTKHVLPDSCTLEEFAEKHDRGTFVVALSGHVVCCVNGNIYDTWDSSAEMILYYWKKEVE